MFVDHYGDLHDPEYRHFPVVATKPKWERGEDDLIDEEEDEEDVFGGPLYLSSRKPTTTSITTPYRPSYAYASYHYDVPHPSPSSYDSNALANEDLEGSPFEDEVSEKKEIKCTVRRIRHRRKSGHPIEEKEGLAVTDVSSTAADADYAPGEFGDHEWT